MISSNDILLIKLTCPGRGEQDSELCGLDKVS